MSLHDNLLSRQGRPKAARAVPSSSRTLVEDRQVAKRAQVATLPPPTGRWTGPGSFGNDHQPSGSTSTAGSSLPLLPGLAPFSVKTLAQRWHVSESSIRTLIRHGSIEHFRIGDLIRIPADEVARYECRR